MKKKRLIPVLLLKNGFLVQSKLFKRYQNLGNPVTSVKRLSDWAADELIYLDITRDSLYDMHRHDLGHPNRDNIIDIISDAANECYMPVTIGGGIRNLKDIALRLANGADKVSINTRAFEEPFFIKKASKEFGSQCIVVSIDVKNTDAEYEVFVNGGQNPISLNPVDWAKRVEEYGAGEILLNSIDRDGSGTGYDIELLTSICAAVSIPVIACGGVGEWAHFAEALEKTNVDAVAAANIFQYTDQSVYLAKKYLFEQGYNVRCPDLMMKEAEVN